MHVDLIESLRCPHPHADGWLVARADVVIDRRIVQGTIGCPTCDAEWPIADGALTFIDGNAIRTPEQPTAVSMHHDAEADALRTAALLNLRDAGSVVVLTGAAANVADALVSLTGVRVLAVNPPAGVALSHSRLFVREALPLGVATLRGARLDGTHAHPQWIDSVSRALQRGGRLIAPVSCAIPNSLREIARDQQEWVADVQVAASGLVPLRRG
jgi:hypothetical protein